MEGKRHGRNTWAQFDDADYNPATGAIPDTRAGFPSFPSFPESRNLRPSHPPSEVSTPPRTVALASQVSGYDESSFSNASGPFLTDWPHPPVSSRAPIAPPVAPAHSTSLDQSTATPVPDPWMITSEQKAYYLAQFLRLQPDPRSKLSGLQAKTFFQLSKLPNTELSDIWELSDADCDGQLTLGEFCVAMHLVVLRRNGIPVPRILPCALLEVISSQSLSTLASGHQNEDGAQSPRGDRFPTCFSMMDRSAHKHTFSPAIPRHSRGSPNTLSPVTPNSSRQQRRWSISSQSDISSIAEGIMHFESRPNADPQLQHPIPVRAHTLPREGTDSEVPQPYATNLDPGQHTRLASSPPPPPPPRARFQSSLVTEQRKRSDEAPGSMLAPNSEGNVLQFPPQLAPDQLDFFTAGLQHKHPTDTEDPVAIVARLRRECDGVSQANEKLAHELMQLQQRRIALKILLERLMPLDAGYPTCFEY